MDQKCCVNFATPLQRLHSYKLSFMVLTQHTRTHSHPMAEYYIAIFFPLHPTQGFAVTGEIPVCVIFKFELPNFILVLLIQLLDP